MNSYINVDLLNIYLNTILSVMTIMAQFYHIYQFCTKHEQQNIQLQSIISKQDLHEQILTSSTRTNLST